MIPKKYRLTKVEVDEVKKSPQTLKTPSFTYLIRNSDNDTKLCVVITKKTINKATQRNKTRRKIIDSFKAVIEYKPKKHLVIILKAKNVNNETLPNQLKTDIKTIWQKE